MTGAHQLHLDDPALCLLIVAGGAEIFLAERLDDGATGMRQHVLTVGEGALVFGFDAEASLLAVSFVAVALPGTQIVPLDRSGLLDPPPDLRPLVAAAVDRWIVALAASLSRPIRPRPRVDRVATPDARLTSGGRIGGGPDVGWCVAEGEALFDDLESVAPGVAVPLTRDSWIAVPAGTALALSGTRELMRERRLDPALTAFLAMAIELLPMTLRLASVDEVNRMRLLAESDSRATRQRKAMLAGALAGKAPDRSAASDQPLVQALARLGQLQGFAIDLPDMAREEPRPFTLEEIARASRLRTREVRLEPGCWTRDSGAFLLLQGALRQPVALWRGRGGRYRLFDPVEGIDRALEPAEAAALAGVALTLYAPLPDRRLTVIDVLASFLRSRGSELMTFAGATLLAGLLALGVPIVTGYVLDTAIPDGDMPKLVQASIALTIVAAMTLTLRVAAQMAMLRSEGIAGTRVQAAVMDRLLRLPMPFFRDFTTGELATRVLAVEQLEKAVTATSIGAVMSGMMAFLSFGLMVYYSPLLALVAAALILAMGIATVAFGLRRVRLEANLVSDNARLTSIGLQLANGIAKIRLAAAENRAMLPWADAVAACIGARIGSRRTAAQLAAFSLGFRSVATAAILGASVHWGVAARLSLGEVVAFLTTFNNALSGLIALAGTAVEMVALIPTARHAAPILAALPETSASRPDPGVIAGEIELSHLKFRYRPDMPPVFEDLSFKVAAGEFVALVGPSGTGKSTLFRLLLGFEQPDAGLVMVDGVDIAGIDIQAVRRQCGVVLQDGKLLPGSLLDNVLGGNMHLSRDQAWDALERVGLADDVRAMPMRLDTMVTGTGAAFSGGQRQRIMLARAIVAGPSVLLLDEATSALDNRTQAAVTASLNRIAATRIVIAHRLSTVEQADRIIVLNRGRVEEEGRYAALIAQGGFFAQLARRQLAVS